MNAAAPLPPSLRAILVDDEPLLRQDLRERLAAHAQIVIVGEAHNVQSAADLVASLKPDVIFLDVRMPPDNGFDLLPKLEAMQPFPAVVFVTAYEKYAIKAFEENALDYLTKPVHPARLAKTVERLRQTLAEREVAANAKDSRFLDPVGLSALPLEAVDLIPLQDGNHVRLVEVSRIAAAESQGDYTRVFAEGGQPLMIRSTLSQWESKLPPSIFNKISRRLLINRRQIQRISRLDRENSEVFLNDIAEPLLLSRIEVRRLKQFL